MARLSMAKAQARIVAKAWKSAAFRRALLKSPHKALASQGVDVPAGVRVRVVQNTPKVMYLVLPAAPKARARKTTRPRTPTRMGPSFTFA